MFPLLARFFIKHLLSVVTIQKCVLIGGCGPCGGLYISTYAHFHFWSSIVSLNLKHGYLGVQNILKSIVKL